MTEPEKKEESQGSPKAGEEGQADKAAEEKAKAEAEKAKAEAEKAKAEEEKKKAEEEKKKAEKAEEEKRRGGAYLIALFIVALDILVIALGTIMEAVPMAFSIGCIGVITFIGVLTLSNHLSRDPALAKNEMRKALAAAFTLVYLALLGFVFFIPADSTETEAASTDNMVASNGAEANTAVEEKVTYDKELAKTVVGHFTWAEGIVITFYFGSRTIEEYKKLKDKGKNNSGGSE